MIVRKLAALVAAAWLMALVSWGLSGLPAVGAAATGPVEAFNRAAVEVVHVKNAVVGVVFDIRALDSLGEELILFAATLAMILILREQRRDRLDDRDMSPQTDEPVERASATEHALAPWAEALLVVLAIYLITHGHLSPGGGFQGGVVLAGAGVMLFVGGRRIGRRSDPVHALELVEALAILGYATVGIAGLGIGGSFLSNVLPKGRFGELFSGGMIPLLSALSGAAVACALSLIFLELVEQSVIAGRPRREEDET